MREHYLANYLAFYDILFVSADGEVVDTIRGEADRGSNLFAAPWRDSALCPATAHGACGGLRRLRDTTRRPANRPPSSSSRSNSTAHPRAGSSSSARSTS
jgi:hypothetical protein